MNSDQEADDGDAGGAALRATYRLQLTPDFGFAHARGLVPYLRDLGVSHLYLSPSLQARPGSTHGYDVIDPDRLSEQLGGRSEFEALSAEAHANGLGIVLDVVPNHMAADEANRFWADPRLRARFFDVDPLSGRHRRFFDIDELAGVRQEDPEVFAATHELVLSLARAGVIDGLRVDHPDGLADPAGYLRALRDGGARRVWVEKILASGERLRDWPVCGTVGYEFLNDAAALLIDPAAEASLSALWTQVTGEARGFAEVATEAKLEQARGTFAPEVARLERELGGAPAPGGRDGLERALSSLPVYRTYLDPEARAAHPADREALRGLEPAYRELLLDGGAPAGFVTRFQQSTPAITAKGIEDTAFYRYLRLASLCEVGGDPGRFGIPAEEWHRGCAERLERFPRTLLSTMTHDAKRSADVRARIGALSTIPAEWERAVQEWMARSEAHRRGGAPDDLERYLIFQTLVGAWPIEADRLTAYVRKALREAKRNTNWIEPDDDWERAAEDFCRALYAEDGFIASLEALCSLVAPLGQRAGLAQVALKLTAPGVPDVYQGDELELRALVDPDNRRPVDFERRRSLLARLRDGEPAPPGAAKLELIRRLLELRARRPEALSDGGYEPLEAGGGGCAFLRGDEVLTVLALPRAGCEREPALADVPAGRWRCVLTGREPSLRAGVRVAELTGERGFAVLERL